MSLLDNTAPTTQRAVLFSAVLAAVAVILYLFAVQPCQDSIARTRSDLSALEDQKRVMERDLKDSPRVKSILSETEKARAPYMDALLTPLLESWAMRAKSLLDPLASDVGLKVLDYSEMPVRALPLPKPPPIQLYARRPIRLTCRGSYAEIASFILRVEKMLPYVALQSFSIKTQQDPEAQLASIVFEWPVKGALSRPAAPAKGGAR
jgi:Tfp pilus assembly protein PilO